MPGISTLRLATLLGLLYTTQRSTGIDATRQGSLIGVFPLDTARAAAAKGTVQGKVDVFLAVHTHNEGGEVDSLLAHIARTGPQSGQDMSDCADRLTQCHPAAHAEDGAPKGPEA